MAARQQQVLLVHGYIRKCIRLKDVSTKLTTIYETIIKYSERKHITIGLFGSFRTGKSTLGGRMCYEFNRRNHTDIDSVNNNMERVTTPRDEKWSSYFDEDEEEQLRMMTIHGNMKEIYTFSYIISLIDTPGYKQYIKNFLRYISQSDVVILVFSATDLIEKYQTNMPSTPNMDKSSFDGYYQLLDKLRICKLFEITQMLIAINKLDRFNYSKHKFLECKTEIAKLLKTVGYTKNTFPVIPISAIHGDNIYNKSTNNRLSWWTNASHKPRNYRNIFTIYDGIEHGISFDDIKIFKENIINIKPFKMSICNIYDEAGAVSGSCSIYSGRIDSGKICIGTVVKCFPSGCHGAVKSIEMFHKKCHSAAYGDIIGISLEPFLLHPQRGDIVINENNDNYQYQSGIASFEALIDIYASGDKINKKYKKAKYNKKLRCFKNGFSPVIHTDNSIKQCQCQMIDILWKVNKKYTTGTGDGKFQQKDENAQYLEPGDTAKVLFEPNRQFAISGLQKIVVLEHKQMIMSGKVVKLHYADEIIEDLK